MSTDRKIPFTTTNYIKPELIDPDYLIDAYAHIIAEQTSGKKTAIPEQVDRWIAEKVVSMVEAEIIRGTV